MSKISSYEGAELPGGENTSSYSERRPTLVLPLTGTKLAMVAALMKPFQLTCPSSWKNWSLLWELMELQMLTRTISTRTLTGNLSLVKNRMKKCLMNQGLVVAGVISSQPEVTDLVDFSD